MFIVLIYYFVGNDGKTQMYLFLSQVRQCICVQDIKGSVGNNTLGIKLSENVNKCVNAPIVLNFTRNFPMKDMPYSTMESLKDGVFYNGRHKKEELIFKSPHVIVFANYRPDLTKLTADRWIGCIFKIRHPHMVLIEDKIKVVDGVAEFEQDDALNHVGIEVGLSPPIIDKPIRNFNAIVANDNNTEVYSNDDNTEVDSNADTEKGINDVNMITKWFKSL